MDDRKLIINRKETELLNNLAINLIENEQNYEFSKADLHIHSTFSKDSLLTPNEIIKLSLKKRIDVVAVTDHNTVKGGVKTKSLAKGKDILVVPGIEVKTDLGDVILLFVEEDFQMRDFNEVLDLAKSIDAITVLPHPFRGHRRLGYLARNVDVIEVVNGRTFRKYNAMAKELAKALKKPISAGSDAHCSIELGCVQLVFLAKITDEEELRKALFDTTPLIIGKESHILVHVISALTQLARTVMNKE